MLSIPANQSLIEYLASLPTAERTWVLSQLSTSELQILETWRGGLARPTQLRPGTDGAAIQRDGWGVWLILAGRGFGKTKTLSEDAIEDVAIRGKRQLALVAPTARDIRDVLIEGPSGVLACSPPSWRPHYEPSLGHKLTWPNGAIAHGYSADEPDRLRGPQHDAAKCDELAAWARVDDAWSNLMFGLRIGNNPDVVAATTPRPTPFLRNLMADPLTVVTRGSSYENRSNLSAQFFARNISRYEGTRLGRQEIYGEVLEDIEGALWRASMIDPYRSRTIPEMVRIVVAIDPAVSAKLNSDETGIVVAGIDHRGHCYVIEDRSGRYTVYEWVRKACQAWGQWRADRIVAEVNNGGDLVEAAIRSHFPAVPYSSVRASRGKQMRAEPVSAMYERGMVHHCGVFPELEKQMTDWVPGEESPDHLDALVWAITELAISPTPVEHRVIEDYRVNISPY